MDEICKKDHRDLEELKSLPYAQDNKSGRHICAGCAYEQGLRDGLDGKAKLETFDHLPRSQAKAVRHKSAKEAYDLGYEIGRKASK